MIDARRPVLLPRHLQLEHFLVLQQPHHVDHGLRLVADPVQVFGAQLVGFQFHVSAIAADQGVARHAGHVHQVAAAGQDPDHHGAHACRGGTRLLPHGMARRDVPDLVADHRRQFGLGIEVHHDPAGDVDVAARQRERVDLVAVEHGEGVLQVGAMALRGNALANRVDVLLQLLVVVAAILLQDLRVHLAPELDLLRLAHRHHVGAAGDRVRGAATQQGCGSAGRKGQGCKRKAH